MVGRPLPPRGFSHRPSRGRQPRWIAPGDFFAGQAEFDRIGPPAVAGDPVNILNLRRLFSINSEGNPHSVDYFR